MTGQAWQIATSQRLSRGQRHRIKRLRSIMPCLPLQCQTGFYVTDQAISFRDFVMTLLVVSCTQTCKAPITMHQQNLPRPRTAHTRQAKGSAQSQPDQTYADHMELTVMS